MFDEFLKCTENKNKKEIVNITCEECILQTTLEEMRNNFTEHPTEKITAYSQRNPLWKNDIMIDRTIGDMGCAVTSAAMLGSQFKQECTPKTLNQYLKTNNGYLSENRLIWSKVCEFVPQMTFDNYYLWRNEPANMDIFLREVKQQPVIIQVDFYPGGGLDTHFVVALWSDGNEVAVIDPWDGARTNLMQRYALGNWDLARAIYAMVVYRW